MQRSVYLFFFSLNLTLAYGRWKFGTRRRTLPHLAGKITTQTRRQTVAKIDAHVLVIPTHVHNSSRFIFVQRRSGGGGVGGIAGPPPPRPPFSLAPHFVGHGQMWRLLLSPPSSSSSSSPPCVRVVQWVCAYVPADGPLTIRPSLG